MTEEWRDIKGYEGKYQVSNMGRVRSLDRTIIDTLGRVVHRKGKIMKPHVDKKTGYCLIAFFNSKLHKERTHLVHRFVAEAFLQGSGEGMQVNHKDENKLNNRADNLEWVTCKENINYGSRTEKAMAAINPKRQRKPVIQMTKDGNVVARYSSEWEAYLKTGYDLRHICHCLKHKPHCKTYKGFRWEYADE